MTAAAVPDRAHSRGAPARPVTEAPARGTGLPTVNCGQLDGPWEQAFFFVVREPVRSKSNHRHDKATRAQWSALKGYADRIYMAARAARPRGWDPGSAAVAVAQRPRIVAFLFARTMLDIANIDKSILDAVEGAPSRGGKLTASGAPVMVADAQVAWVTETGERTDVDPGVLIGFARLPAGAPQAAVTAAGIALAQACTALLAD